MPNYRRANLAGGTYFITQVTYLRVPWLCSEVGRKALREAIQKVQEKYPFSIDAFVLLPEHFHCQDQDCTGFDIVQDLIMNRIRPYFSILNYFLSIPSLHQSPNPENPPILKILIRFWEHLIRDERDFAQHCDYIHYNPVRHGLCETPQDWQFSSIHRFIVEGIYPPNWGLDNVPEMPRGIWD